MNKRVKPFNSSLGFSLKKKITSSIILIVYKENKQSYLYKQKKTRF